MKALVRISILSALVAMLFTGACATIVDERSREPAMMPSKQTNELFNIQLSLLSLMARTGEAETGIKELRSAASFYPFKGVGIVIGGFSGGTGNRIHTVFRGSPAEKAGLRRGDLLVAVAGSPVCSGEEEFEGAKETKQPSCATLFSLVKAVPDTFTMVVNRGEGEESIVLTKALVGEALATAIAERMPEWEASIRANETVVRDFGKKLAKVRGEQRPLSEAEMEAIREEAAVIIEKVHGPFDEIEALKGAARHT